MKTVPDRLQTGTADEVVNVTADRLQTGCEWLMAAALAVMFVAVFGNVVLRYGFNSGIAASEELARLCFVWLVFLGAILAMHKHAHIGFDLVQRLLPRPLRRLCAAISHILMLYALWLLLYGSWTQTVIGLDISSPVMGYPLALTAAAGLVVAIAMGGMILTNLWRLVRDDPQARIPGDTRPAE